MKTLTHHDLAEILHISPATVISRLSRNPESLPPKITIESHRNPLWLQEDVEAWLREHRDARS